MPTASQIAAALTKRTEHVCKMLVLEIDKELRKRTPVDTGHARRNWIPSVGAPNTQEAKDDSAHAQGVTQVLAYKLSQGALWVANVAPYILALNYGHSQQQAAGWVEVAIDQGFTNAVQKAPELAEMHSEYRAQTGAVAAGNLASAYNPLGGDDD